MTQKSAGVHLGWVMLVVLVATASFGADTLFKLAGSYPSGGTFAEAIATADVNGDGKVDVLVAHGGTNVCCLAGYVGVLLGNGDGTFQAASSYYSGGPDAVSIAVADVNRDGKPDVLVANVCAADTCNHGGLGVLLGNGNGTFQPAVSYGSGGYYTESLAAADVNGDGKLDVVLASSSPTQGSGGIDSSVVGVLLGRGDGTFQPAMSYVTGGFEANSVGELIAISDVNRDSKPDVLVSLYCMTNCGDGGWAAVLLGNGDGTFQPVQTYSSGGAYPDVMVAADVNADGKIDLLMSGTLLLGNGDGTFQAGQIIGFGGRWAAAADLDRDGKLDVASVSFSNQVRVFLGNGEGAFPVSYSYRRFGGWGALSIAVADVNGDSKPDLLVASACLSRTDCTSGSVGVFLGLTKFTTSTSVSSSLNPSIYGQAVTLTATVNSTGTITPTGTVTIKNGNTVVGSPKLVDGVAVVTRKNLPAGTLAITATYNGDTQSAKSKSAPLTQVVSQATTATTITSSSNPSAQGQAVTFTAKVTSPTLKVTGNVTFKAGTTELGTITLSGGKASITTTALPQGNTTVTATYDGTPNIVGSAASLTQVVN
ncbi:MAG: FG-GAP-like repeat-containing protein [Terriglobales bacterium]